MAFIVSLLGYMPPPGTVLTVPKEYTEKYSAPVQIKAKRCAARYKITLEIAK